MRVGIFVGNALVCPARIAPSNADKSVGYCIDRIPTSVKKLSNPNTAKEDQEQSCQIPTQNLLSPSNVKKSFRFRVFEFIWSQKFHRFKIDAGSGRHHLDLCK